MSGVMGYLHVSLLQIYHWVCQQKNFENRLTFGEVMGKSLVSCFFDSWRRCKRDTQHTKLTITTLCNKAKPRWYKTTAHHTYKHDTPFIKATNTQVSGHANYLMLLTLETEMKQRRTKNTSCNAWVSQITVMLNVKFPTSKSIFKVQNTNNHRCGLLQEGNTVISDWNMNSVRPMPHQALDMQVM